MVPAAEHRSSKCHSTGLRDPRTGSGRGQGSPRKFNPRFGDICWPCRDFYYLRIFFFFRGTKTKDCDFQHLKIYRTTNWLWNQTRSRLNVTASMQTWEASTVSRRQKKSVKKAVWVYRTTFRAPKRPAFQASRHMLNETSSLEPLILPTFEKDAALLAKLPLEWETPPIRRTAWPVDPCKSFEAVVSNATHPHEKPFSVCFHLCTSAYVCMWECVMRYTSGQTL